MAEVIIVTEHGQVPASIVPTNLNEESFITFTKFIKGGLHNYPYLKAPASDPSKWDDANRKPVLDAGGDPVDPKYLPPYREQAGLLDLHPDVMEENMEATVKLGFERVKVVLTRNPSFINYGDITEDNWNKYWTVVSRIIPENAQILEFAEEYDGSISGWPDPGRPPYDDATGTYPSGAEFDALWETVQDTRKHRWYRIKYGDYDENDDFGVVSISPPIPIGEDSTTFVQEVFKYKRVGEKGVDDPVDVQPARPPAFTSTGQPNNSPTGWEDNIPSSPATQYLWRIRGLRELKGDINTQVGWSEAALIPEDNETIRYSATGKPNPDKIVGPSEDVADGTNEADLVAAGWDPVFDDNIHKYIATRSGSSQNWTNWKVERISPQDTEIVKRRYKLLPLLSDYDNSTWIANNKPSGSDPSNQGWLNELQPETNFLINFVSEAVFYADNTIKQDWSNPLPFTSRNTYTDYISIHPDDSGIDDTREIDDTIIKRFVSGVETHDPEDLWLRPQLFLGQNDITQDSSVSIAYQWTKIYNDGEFLTTPTDLGTNRDIKVNHSDVTGRAIFKVTMTLSDAGGSTDIADAIAAGAIPSNPVFEEQISIKDQVDGRDARTITATSTQPYFIENSDPAYLPNSILIHAEVDNADKNDVKWYYLNGSDPINDTWIEITATTNTSGSSPKHTYKNANNDLVLVGGPTGTATDIFSTVLSQDDVYFKAEIPAQGSLDERFDLVMVSRRDQADLAAGESALGHNIEGLFHEIRVDILGDYISGQISDFEAKVEVRKGSTVLVHGDWTISNIAVTGVLTDANDVLIGNDGGNKKIITLDEPNINWDNTKEKGTITFDITYSGETIRGWIGLGTALEPEGRTGLNIISDRATLQFDYTTNGRDDIVLTANLTKETPTNPNEPVAGYNYEWFVVSGRYKSTGTGNVISDPDANDEVLTVSHDDLDQVAVYRCYAYLTKTGSSYNQPFYTDEVRITDLPDNSRKILYNANDITDVPPLPTAEYSTYPNNSSGTDSWYKNEQGNGNDTWYSTSYEGGAAGTWEGPFRLTGTPGNDGADGADGQDGSNGADGADGGLYNWEGTESINVSTNINGARVHNLGKIQNDDLAGLWISIYHTDLETGARVAVGTTTGNATELGVFNGSNNETQWRTFWCPIANIPSETDDAKLYIWSSTNDGGTLRKIIVHAAVSGLEGADGVNVQSATINSSGNLVLTLSDASTVNAGRVEYKTEYRNNGTYIQWKYTYEGAGSWRNLVALSDISGEDGVADGLSKVVWDQAGTHGFYQNLDTGFSRGTYVDTGNSNSKTILITAWMSVDFGNTTIRLRIGTRTSPGYNGGSNNSVINQKLENTDASRLSQHLILTTSDRYVYVSVGDNGGGAKCDIFGIKVEIQP